jgi:hypothetical protein
MRVRSCGGLREVAAREIEEQPMTPMLDGVMLLWFALAAAALLFVAIDIRTTP